MKEFCGTQITLFPFANFRRYCGNNYMRYVNGIIVIISHYNSCGGREINNIHGFGTMEAKPLRQKRRKRKEFGAAPYEYATADECDNK